jgi:dephospho-CoA kinase
VDAPVEVRFERERRRNREGAVGTLEAFVALEARERGKGENAQQLDATLDLADEVLVNDRTLEDLADAVRGLLRLLECRRRSRGGAGPTAGTGPEGGAR